MDAQRELLDSLMGANRNGDNPDAVIHSYKDERVCRNMLCEFCPYELFNNTKEDHGECNFEVHDEKWREDYEKDHPKDQWGPWEHDFLRCLERFMGKCDRVIERGNRRLEESGEGAAPKVNLETAAEVVELTAKIDEAIKKSEAAGEEGDVDESLRLMEEAEALKQKKAQVQAQVLAATRDDKQAEVDKAAGSVNQKLRVCEVCGAMLSIFDSDRRLADHFGGKIHLGYLRIRETVKKLREKRERLRPSFAPQSGHDPRRARGYGRDDRRGGGYYRRDDRRDDRRDRDRYRSSRDRGHDRPRDHDRRRDDRDRDRHSRRRSHSRDRRHRRRSHSRSRSPARRRSRD